MDKSSLTLKKVVVSAIISVIFCIAIIMTTHNSLAGNGSCYSCSCSAYNDAGGHMCTCGHSFSDHALTGY